MGVASAHVFGLRVNQVAIVLAALKEEFIVFLMAQKLCGLGYAPVVVGIFKGFGNGFIFFVEGNVAKLCVFRQTVVIGVCGGGLHGLVCPLVVEALNALYHHVGKYRNGMVAYHAPGLSAVEGPDWQHVLCALVVMLQHRVGKICLQRLVNQVQKRMEGPVSVPKREGRIVCKAICRGDVSVMGTEAAVNILEQEGMQGGAVNACVEGFLVFLAAFRGQFVAGQLCLPKCDCVAAYGFEVLAFQLFKAL